MLGFTVSNALESSIKTPNVTCIAQNCCVLGVQVTELHGRLNVLPDNQTAFWRESFNQGSTHKIYNQLYIPCSSILEEKSSTYIGL